ncbi:MAG: exo-rhamnogalacturonan lyase family protein [Planctomycetota bacterium]|jgi:hypothetical protein
MRRHLFFASLLLLLLSFATAGRAGEGQRVPLLVTEPTGTARKSCPITGGVPVKPLGVKGCAVLTLLDSAGKPVPAQITPMVKGEDGVLHWVLVDFQADLEAGGTNRYFLQAAAEDTPRPAPAGKLSIQQDDDRLVLANGALKVAVSKKTFDVFDMIWLDRNADGAFTDDEKMLAAERPPALVVQRAGDGAVFDSRGGTVQRVALEDSGQLRATVRIDGTFRRSDGEGEAAAEKWLAYTVRLTAWAGRPELRLLYSIRNVNEKAVYHAHIKRAAFTLAGAAPTGKLKHYLLGGGEVRMSQISSGADDVQKGSQWHNAVEISQLGPPTAVCGKSARRFYKLVNFEDAGYRVRQHQHGKRRPIVDIGFECGGWVALGGDGGGCLLWLRNFTRDCPKRLTARADGSIEVEVIPEYDGKAQPYYSDGGYSLGDRSHLSFELGLRFRAAPFCSADDWKLFSASYANYIRPTPASAAAALTAVAGMNDRPQLVSTPQWYTRTGALWGEMPTVEEENAAARRIGWKTPAPVNRYHVGDLAKDFLHYENFHYRSEWDEPRDCLVEFLRTGRWATFTRGHAFARNYRDLGVWRTDGKALGARAAWTGAKKGAWAIPRWGKFCGCHHYGAGLIDYWLLTGDRSYLEAGVEWGRQCAVTDGYGGFGSRHWGRRMASALRAYQVTRDPQLKKLLIAHCRPPTPSDALRADGRALLAGKKMASWMATLCTNAVWHNYLEHRDAYGEVELDDFEDGIIGMARQVANYWWNEETKSGPYHFLVDGAGPGKIKFNGGGPAYSLTCIDTMTRGYLLTGDRHLLDSAVKYWNNVNGPEATVQRARLQDFAGMGSGSFWARQLVYALANPRQDSRPPEAVADLKAEALGGGKVRLTWTAPKDDSGKAARYQLKHAPAPFCIMRDYRFPEDQGKKWTWWAGYNVAGEPQPGEPGAEQSMTVEGVPAGKRYFCVRSSDASRNESALGNVLEVEVK